ncbi:excalibur calcium-binding domain-containing protein [Nocardia sp. NPDC003693]
MNRTSDVRSRARMAAVLGAVALGLATLPAAGLAGSASAEPRIDNSPPSTSRSQPYPYYANCHEVRQAGKAPLLVGQPGYNRRLDRDGNGIACG